MSNDIRLGIRIGYDGKAGAAGAAGTRDAIKQIGETATRSGAEASQALDRTAVSAKQTAAALRNVPAQFTDIFTSIAAGQNPMQVMLQQGGQLKDMFGGIGPAARALGGYIVGLVNPYTIAAAAVGGLTYAYYQGAKETDGYTRSLILSGNAAGTTAAQLADAARRVSAATGGTQGAAAEALTLAVGAGVPGAALHAVADAAVRMEQVTGKAIDETVVEFAKLARDPVAASLTLTEQYNYLTESTYRQIKALQDQGRHTDAAKLAMKTYADVVAERAGEITRNLGPVEDKWLGIKAAGQGALDAVLWRPQDDLTAAVEKVLSINTRIAAVKKSAVFDASAQLEFLEKELAAARAHMVVVRDKANAETAAAAAKAKANEQARAGIKLAQEEERLAKQKKRPGRAFDPEGDLEWAVGEAQRKASQKEWLEWEKELAREAAAAEKAWSDAARTAQQDMEKRLDSLDAQAAKTEIEVANYGLAAADIERNTIARLEERRAIDAGVDGLEDSVAALDREIETRKRLAAAADSKAALDANKRATEEMQREWERMHDQISQSLTDELMKGGQSAGELLQSYFRTLVLRPVIQGVVSAGVSAVGEAAGKDAGGGSGGGGGGSGGLFNLLSLGSNISSLGGISGGYAIFATSGIGSALGLGSATAAGYSAPVFASALEGGALLSAGSGTAAGGLSALGSSIGAALPWIGGALAIASIFGGDLFGGKESPPEAYINQHRLKGINSGWVDFVGGMGIATPFDFLQFATQHMDGDARTRNTQYTDQYLRPVGEADKLIAGLLSDDEIGKVSASFGAGRTWNLGGNPNSAGGALMLRLGMISDAIGGWVDRLADTTKGTLEESYTELAQLLSIRGDAELERLANDMFNVTGAWSYDQFTALQSGVESFNSLFLDESDQLQRYSEAMRKAFDSLNLVLPTSRDGFKDLVTGIDTSTKAGFELYATLLDLSPTMAAYYDALQSELAVKSELIGATNENKFATAVAYRRYQGVAANYDPTFAADYAYNISQGTIRPGGAANDAIISELRSLRTEQGAQGVALATSQAEMTRILRRWNGDGMPETRVVA